MDKPTEGTRCSEQVYDSFGFGNYSQCKKKAVVIRNDKPYCKIHDPEYVRDKRGKRQKRESIELNLRVAGKIAGNQCYQINPSNPQVVAENIGEMHRMLESIQENLSLHPTGDGLRPYILRLDYKTFSEMCNLLSKLEGE